MAIEKRKIENLKPGKKYALNVKVKNTDLNIVSDLSDTIIFTVPTDTTIPSALTNLELFAGLENVMFVFDYSEDLDIRKYEYELYQNSDMSDETGPRTGFADANIFTVSVNNLQLEEDGGGLARFWGRARAIDTTGNAGPWTSLVETDDRIPLIDNQYIGSLTASKITAGTISSHTITLNSASSIIKSSNFDGTPVGDGSYSSATTGWLINGQGKAYFYDATVVGSIDLGGFDSGSFHVNTSGDMWLGAGTYGAAPFRVSRDGVLEIGAGTGSTIGGQLIDSIAEAVIDFNGRNNRNSTNPTPPTLPSPVTVGNLVIGASYTIVSAGTTSFTSIGAANNTVGTVFTATGVGTGTGTVSGETIDHTLNTDGSANISFEWNYTYSSADSAANNIDGFYVHIYSSDSSSPYVIGTTPNLESTYPVDYLKRSIVFSGLPADKYYTFGVKAFRVVDKDIATPGIKYSSIVQSSVTQENPYRPSANVNYTGNIGGTLASTLVSYANAGNTVATNFNTNNDNNGLTPTSPVIVSNGTAIDHTINTDGSADISFEWTYTVSDTYNVANNIDGFIVYVRSTAISGATPSSYTFGSSPSEETTYYLPREKRAFILPGVAANRNYNFAVRAYRMVNTNVASPGIVYSPIIQSTYGGESFYQPSTTVAFAGNITGTIDNIPVSTLIERADAGNTVATNFNTNNDNNGLTPTSPVIVSNGTAIDHTINTDGSADISFEWTYTNSDAYNAANNIDGFIVYVRSTDISGATPSSSYVFGSDPSKETTYYLPREMRAFILPGVAANRNYNFAVRAYRMVNSNVATPGIIYSPIIQSTYGGEPFYQPSTSVNYTGNISGTLSTTLVSYANAGNTVATNFNTNNDNNGLTPTSPTLPSSIVATSIKVGSTYTILAMNSTTNAQWNTTAGTTAVTYGAGSTFTAVAAGAGTGTVSGETIDHVLNTDGSVDISFEWLYTNSDLYSDANNIDGFIVYVRSSTIASAYTIGTTPAEETTYYLPRERRAFILPGVASNRYYTLGVRAYRMVNSNVATPGIIYSSIVQSSVTGENPYQPSATVAFAGNITGTVNGTAVATLVSYADAGNTVATNFNANNDTNGLTPTSPVIVSNGTAIDHTINTDGSADISFEWTYTVSDTYNVANNIDGFIVYVRSTAISGATPSSYTFGSSPSEETTYYLPREKRAFILPGVAANRNYNFAVRAYRMVNTNVASPGIIYSPIIQSTYGGELFYQPSTTVAFAGNVTGTINNVDVATLVSYADAGNTVATNFNANNDTNGLTPTSPVIVSNGTAIDHTINTDGSADISFEWTYTVSDTYNVANNIDGFIVYVRSTAISGATPSSYTFGSSPSEETTYYLPREKRAFILPGVAANRNYNFAVRAYRMVNTNVASPGIVYSPIIQSTYGGESFYQPSTTVAFAGNITGTVNGTAVTTITTGINNFNNNNDQKTTTPATPTSVAFSTATSNTNASIDLPLSWAFTGSGDAYDVDGFIVFLRTTTVTDATSITTSDLNTNIQQVFLTAEKRSHTFSGISPSAFYRAAVRAYRVVDTNVNSAGILYGPLANTTERSSVIATIGGSSGISIGNGKIYIGTGTFNNVNTSFYVDSTGQFSLKDKLVWDGTTLTVKGTLQFSDGTTPGTFDNGDAITAGSIAGVTINSTKMYIGTGTFNNANTAFYVDNAGQLSLKDKLSWNGTTLTVTGSITGSTITGSTLTTASSGNRVHVNTNDITLYYDGNDVSNINFSGNSLYTSSIISTGTIKVRGNSDNGQVRVGTKPGLGLGTYIHGTEGVQINGGEDSAVSTKAHLTIGGSTGNQANLTLQCNTTEIQLRTANNDSTLYLRRADDTAYANLALGIMSVSGNGISYTGNGYWGGTANAIGITWISAYGSIMGHVDNANSIVLGTTSDRRLKGNIQNSNTGLSLLNNLRVVSYNPLSVSSFENGQPIVSGIHDDVTMIGLIADEVEMCAPWLVSGDSKIGQLQSVNYALITPILINAIKEISQRLEILENK